MTKVCVLGAGAWGTALAIQAHRAGNEVSIWAYLQEEKDEIEKFHENKSRLPGVSIPKDISVTCDLKDAVDSADIILVVTPAQVIREFLKSLKPHLQSDSYLVLCSKGLEISTGSLLSEICTEIIPETELAVLAGPNFAKEIAVGAAGAATIATNEISRSRWLASALSSDTFRIYPSDDIIGVQIGGALKNVVAIGAGIVTGLNMGENARAALITRGLQEMAAFAEAKGGRQETLLEVSGVGDLVLCTTSRTSRNMNFGLELGQGGNTQAMLKDSKALTEGVFTAKAIMKLIKENNFEMPVFEAVYNILHQGKDMTDEMNALFTEPNNNANKTKQELA